MRARTLQSRLVLRSCAREIRRWRPEGNGVHHAERGQLVGVDENSLGPGRRRASAQERSERDAPGTDALPIFGERDHVGDPDPPVVTAREPAEREHAVGEQAVDELTADAEQFGRASWGARSPAYAYCDLGPLMCLRGCCWRGFARWLREVSILPNSLVVWVLSQSQTEEVSMHPMMIMALAREIERERRHDRPKVQLRSLAVANPGQDFEGSPAAGGFARRLILGISLRARFS